MKKFTYLLILIFVICFTCIYEATPMTSNQEVKLSLKTDKEAYCIGDAVILEITFSNNSSKSIYLLPWNGGYSVNWLMAFDIDEQKKGSFPLVYRDIKFMPLFKDYILINPNSKYSITLKGKIFNGELSKFNRDYEKKYQGLFLNFGDSAIFLNSIGSFGLQAFYVGKNEWADIAKKKYNIDGIILEKLESNKIHIEVR